MSQRQTRAQLFEEGQERSYTWRRFREWLQDSLFVVPLLFIIGAVLLALALIRVDRYLLSLPEAPAWWLGTTDTVVTVTTVISSSMLAFLAVVFSVTLVALQLASQQYSPRVVHAFERSGVTKVTLSLFLATFVFSMVLLSAMLRSEREQVTVVTVLVAVLLVFASLITFVAFLRSILVMLRVPYIISHIADGTRQAIQRQFPPEDAYVLCQAEPLGVPNQVIGHARPRRRLFASRYSQSVLQAIQTASLVHIARQRGCVLRVILRHGDYVIQGDPLVEVYGASGLGAEGVLAAFHVGPERTVTQDAAYGLRILVDMALQALSPAVNAPTTASQALYPLTDLLASSPGSRPQPGCSSTPSASFAWCALSIPGKTTSIWPSTKSTSTVSTSPRPDKSSPGRSNICWIPSPKGAGRRSNASGNCFQTPSSRARP